MKSLRKERKKLKEKLKKSPFKCFKKGKEKKKANLEVEEKCKNS